MVPKECLKGDDIQALKLGIMDEITHLDPRTYGDFVQYYCPSCRIGTLKSTLLNVLNRIAGKLHKVPWEKVIKLRKVPVRFWCKGDQVECEGKGLPMQVRIHVR